MKLSKNQLRQKVISRIYENHNGSITGPLLQEILLDFIDSLKEDVEPGGEADFVVSSLDINSTQINAGDPINVAATIQNIGGGQGSEVLKLELAWLPFTIPTIPKLPTISNSNIARASLLDISSSTSEILDKSFLTGNSASLIKPTKRVIWTKSVNVSNISPGGNFTTSEVVPTDDATPGKYVLTATIGDQSKSASLNIVSEKRYVVSGTVTALITKRVEKIPVNTRAFSSGLTDAISSTAFSGLDSIRNTGSFVPSYSPVLKGVKVSLKGSRFLSVFTDNDGNYIIETDQPIGSGSLVFSLAGYFIKEEPIKNRTVIDVGLVKKSIITIPDDIDDRFGILDDFIINKGDIFDNDVVLKDNFDKTKGFLDVVSSTVNLKGTQLENGDLNTDITSKFKDSISSVFEETKKLQDEITANGSTKELNDRLEANVDLINTGVTSYLNVLSSTNKDVDSGSETFSYLETELKDNLSKINSSSTTSVFNNIGNIGSELAGKNNLSNLVTGLKF